MILMEIFYYQIVTVLAGGMYSRRFCRSGKGTGNPGGKSVLSTGYYIKEKYMRLDKFLADMNQGTRKELK